ncbi:relaxase [gamma proteobacterium BDW918]|nr:relaxase [gamma proteobacterium BDW918]
MFKKLFGRGQGVADPAAAEDTIRRHGEKQYHRALAAQELLSEALYASKVSRVKRNCRATEAIWQKHYLSAIQRFAELVQGAPASENHHHSHHGGLLEHTLEALANGGLIAQGYMLPPGVEPEDMISGIDKWHFGVFVAILAHDLGKIVTDIEFVFRLNGGQFVKWHPWSGPMPIGAEYDYRYKPRLLNSTVGKSLHEKASISLVPLLLTNEAINWMFSDTELVGQVLNTVSASSIGGGAVAEILRKADMASVAGSVGASRDVAAAPAPGAQVALHEKCLSALRRLIDDGDLKKNKPGAAVWITETHTWVVSRPGAEAIKARLLSEGHKGIPNNPVRLFDHLLQAGYVLPSEDGESIWQAEVHDVIQGWTQKLSFLCFENGTIWPTSTPPALFDGSVTPISRSGEATKMPAKDGGGIAAQAPLTKQYPVGELPEASPSIAEPRIKPEKVEIQPKPEKGVVEQQNGRLRESFESRSESHTPPTKESAGLKQTATGGGAGEQTATRKVVLAKNPEPAVGEIQYADDGKTKMSEEDLRKNQFFSWLLDGIANRAIKVNEPKAPVHIVDDHVALITPVIFNKFFEPPLTRKRYELSANGKPLYTLMQKQVCGLGIVSLGPGGTNIVKVSVEGSRKKGQLHAILIPKRYFPSLRSLKNNAAISIVK